MGAAARRLRQVGRAAKATLHAVAVLQALVLNGLLSYAPGPPHAEFIGSAEQRLLVRAGNQTGKTYAAAVKTWNFVLAHPGCTFLVVCADHTAKVEVVGKALWDLAPRHALAAGCDWNITRGWRNDVIQLTNGATIVFRSSEGSTVSIAGLTVHGAWVDEPPKQSQWGEIVSRVAVHEGPIWLTMTPVGREVGWLRLMIEGDAVKGVAPSEHWKQIVFELTPEHCPWRSEASIQAQCEGYGLWEYNQRVHGAWEGVTADRVLDGFKDESVSDVVPAIFWKSGLGFDHGELAGREAAGFVIWSPERKIVIALDEYISDRSTTPAEDGVEVTTMLGRYGQAPHGIDLAVGDTNSSGKMAPGTTINRMLEAELPGLSITRPSKVPGSVDYGIRLINLAYRRGILKVHPRCKGFIRFCRHWRGKDTEEDKRLGHIGDGFRYILVPILEQIFSPDEIDRIKMIR